MLRRPFRSFHHIHRRETRKIKAKQKRITKIRNDSLSQVTSGQKTKFFKNFLLQKFNKIRPIHDRIKFWWKLVRRILQPKCSRLQPNDYVSCLKDEKYKFSLYALIHENCLSQYSNMIYYSTQYNYFTCLIIIKMEAFHEYDVTRTLNLRTK